MDLLGIREVEHGRAMAMHDVGAIRLAAQIAGAARAQAKCPVLAEGVEQL